MEVLLGRKKFLNHTGYHSVACIGYSLTLDDNNGRTVPYPDGTMYITDCSRTITLELDIVTKKQLKNTLHKLNVIIAVAEQAKLDAVKINKLYKKEKKKRKKNE